jgi:hypothetical protein
MGTVEDAACTARMATCEVATTTWGLVANASSASSGICVVSPKCVVMARLRFSTKPSWPSSGITMLRNASIDDCDDEITAMRLTCSGVCPRATNGHPTAPPTSAMNFRRLITLVPHLR